MAWLPWIFVVVAVSLVLGPIMMLRPTIRQRRLALLRRAAQDDGLMVRVVPDPALESRRFTASYALAWPAVKEKPVIESAWLLVRTNYTHGLHFHNRWDWKGSAAQLSHEQKIKLTNLLDELSDGIHAVEVNRQGVACYWDEKVESSVSADQAVQVILGWNRRLMALVSPRLQAMP